MECGQSMEAAREGNVTISAAAARWAPSQLTTLCWTGGPWHLRRERVVQRFLAILLILAGLGGAGYGIATVTVLRDSDTVVATADPSGDATMLVTVPGVLGMVNERVTVRASVPEGQKVTLAIGTETDVLGWVGEDPYDSVTGMADWTELSVVPGRGVSEDGEDTSGDGENAEGSEEGDAEADAEASEKPASGPEPAGSDMWISEVSGETSVSLRYTDQPGPYVLLAAGVGDGAEAPTVELTWPRQASTPYLWPGVIGGSFFVLVGVFLLVGARKKPGSRGSKGKGGNAKEGSKTRKRGAKVRQPLDGQGDAPQPGTDTGSPPPFSPGPGEDSGGAFPSGGAEQSPFPPVDDDQAAAPFPAAAVGTWGSAPTPPPAFAEPDGGGTISRPEPAAPARAGVWSAAGSSAAGLPSQPVEHPTAQQAPTGPPEPGSLRRRRGRRGARDAGDAVPAAPAASVPTPQVPVSPTAAPPAASPPAAPPAPAASGDASGESGKFMTRRERRLAEQAMRRGNTGVQPVVPPQQPESPSPEQPQPGQQTSNRAAAWREAWGIKDGEN